MLVTLKSVSTSTKTDMQEVERLKRMVIKGVTTSFKKDYGKNFNVRNCLNSCRHILTQRDLDYYNYQWAEGDTKIAVSIMVQTVLYILNEMTKGNNCGLGELRLEIKNGNVIGIMCVFNNPIQGMIHATNTGISCEV